MIFMSKTCFQFEVQLQLVLRTILTFSMSFKTLLSNSHCRVFAGGWSFLPFGFQKLYPHHGDRPFLFCPRSFPLQSRLKELLNGCGKAARNTKRDTADEQMAAAMGDFAITASAAGQILATVESTIQRTSSEEGQNRGRGKVQLERQQRRSRELQAVGILTWRFMLHIDYGKFGSSAAILPTSSNIFKLRDICFQPWDQLS